MSYEPGSLDCRLLIDAKHHLELALASCLLHLSLAFWLLLFASCLCLFVSCLLPVAFLHMSLACWALPFAFCPLPYIF